MNRIDALYKAAQQVMWGHRRNPCPQVEPYGCMCAPSRLRNDMHSLANPQTVMALIECYRAAMYSGPHDKDGCSCVHPKVRAAIEKVEALSPENAPQEEK